MEYFTISVDFTDKVCTIIGSQIGLIFLEQEKGLAEKFILFCSEKYSNGIEGDVKWQIVSKGLKTKDVLPQDDNQPTFNTTNTDKLEPGSENAETNNELGEDYNVNKYQRKCRSKYRSQKSENESETESSEMVQISESSYNETDPTFSSKNTNCGIEIGSSACLRKHQTKRMQSRKTSFICKTCRKVFTERQVYDHHMENTECAFSCSRCKLEFSSKQDLLEHGKEHLNCEKCGKVFRTKVVLDNHMATHSSLRPFQCETCGACFKLRSTLNLHRRTHFTTNTFKCTSCDKQFRSADGIKNHKIKYHMTEEELATYKKKVYTCDHCGKKTGQKHVHIRHVRSHTGEKPYDCSDCNKSFPTCSALNIHRKKHDGKIETCNICKLNFWENSKYNRHLKSKKHKALAARQINTSLVQDTDTEEQNSVVVVSDSHNENIANNMSSTYIILPDTFQNIQVGNLEILRDELESAYTVNEDSVIVQTEL